MRNRIYLSANALTENPFRLSYYLVTYMKRFYLLQLLMFNDLNALDICDAVSTVDYNKCLYVAVRVYALFISSTKYTCVHTVKDGVIFKVVK